ncbi:MAG: shikimate dehydrogenase [Alphaproteobacteria bacterium]
MLSGTARIAGIMGAPVRHSRSPRLHGYWLERYGIDGAYLPLAVAPEDLAAALHALPKLGFSGVNLTVPHKEAALRYMSELTATAQRIGAVNTVVVGADGRLAGDNTDAFGFIENLRETAPRWRADAGPAVVLGAGGAARAVAVALADAGVGELRVVNRTMARAETLATDLGGPLTAQPWEARNTALDGARLLVNATSLGMAGQPVLDIDLAGLAGDAVVADIVYVPLTTALLAAATERGLATVDGLGMLLHQARPGFAAWFGVEPAVTAELRAFMRADLGA